MRMTLKLLAKEMDNSNFVGVLEAGSVRVNGLSRVWG